MIPKDTARNRKAKGSLLFQQKVKGPEPKKGSSGGVEVTFPEVQPTAAAGEYLFASCKRSRRDFVLVKVLESCSYSIIHYVAIEGRLQQLEVGYINNPSEAALLLRSKRLNSGGLFVELKSVSEEEYRHLERIARRQLQVVMGSRKQKSSLKNLCC